MDAVVAQEEVDGVGDDLFVLRIAQRAAHQHVHAISDVAGDDCIGQSMAAQVAERGVDAGYQIGARVDEGAVEVEGDEAERGGRGERAQALDHFVSVKGD